MAKKRVSNAMLVRAPSVVHLTIDTPDIVRFVVKQLLDGINIQVEVDDKLRVGHVHQLEFAKGSSYVYATVTIENPSEDIDDDNIRVAIGVDGKVDIMPQKD